MKRRHRRRTLRAHRWLGLIATVSLVGWIGSSFVLHGVGLALPENGLRGDYELRPHARSSAPADGAADGEADADAPERDRTGPEPLASAATVGPDELLDRLEADGLDRIYWLRLTWLAGEPAYVVKPGLFALERTYDARSNRRLDPLSRETLRRVANGELVGTRAVSGERPPEFNRYYAVNEVPAGPLSLTARAPAGPRPPRPGSAPSRRSSPSGPGPWG